MVKEWQNRHNLSLCFLAPFARRRCRNNTLSKGAATPSPAAYSSIAADIKFEADASVSSSSAISLSISDSSLSFAAAARSWNHLRAPPPLSPPPPRRSRTSPWRSSKVCDERAQGRPRSSQHDPTEGRDSKEEVGGLVRRGIRKESAVHRVEFVTAGLRRGGGCARG